MKKLTTVFQKSIVGVTFLCTLAILFFLYTGKLKSNYNDSVAFRLLLLVLTISLFFGIMTAFRWIEICSRRTLLIIYIFCAFLFVMFSAVALLNFASIQTTDAARVMDQAIIFAREGAGPEHLLSRYQQYFGRYGNNYFFTIVFSWFYRLLYRLGISDVLFPSYLLNLLAVGASLLLAVLTVIRVRGYRCGAKALLLGVFNPLIYLMIFWVYTNTLSLPFMIGVIYFGVVCTRRSQ